jgi:hypothetical protein
LTTFWVNIHNLLTLHAHIDAWRVLAAAEDRCRLATPSTLAAETAAYVRQRVALMSTHCYRIAGIDLCTLDIEFNILRARLNPPVAGPLATDVVLQRIANGPTGVTRCVCGATELAFAQCLIRGSSVTQNRWLASKTISVAPADH